MKSFTMANGEQVAMMLGISMTLTWFGDTLDSQGWLPMPTLASIMPMGLALCSSLHRKKKKVEVVREVDG